MQCRNCGAEIPNGSTVCDYCRSAIPPPEPIEAGRPTSRQASFDRIKTSPEYALRKSAERLQSLSGRGIVETAAPVAFLALFVVVGLFMSGAFLSGPAPGWMAIVPIALVGFGAVALVTQLLKLGKFAVAPILSRAAIVVAKRLSVSGGDQNSPARTSYFMTCEFESGRREEFGVRLALYGQLSEQDVGILYSRDNVAVDFDRVID